MSIEDDVRAIVEQVLANLHTSETIEDLAEEKEEILPAENSQELPDLTELEQGKSLLVPVPYNKAFYEQMKKATPARIGVWRAGPRPLTEVYLRFRADHAAAQDAVLSQIPADFLERFNFLQLQSACRSKDEHLTRPDLGRLLDEESLTRLRKEAVPAADVQIIVSDGLSSTAVVENLPNLLPALEQGLQSMGLKTGTPLFVKYGRVAVMDIIGEELKPKTALILIGERPGLGNAASLSAYLAYNPRRGMLENERTVVSNIHRNGTPAPEAGAYLASLLEKVLKARASGVKLASL
ncbi:MAG: ethanolamine ammonia-lyase subunit EutC [Zhaonellaceae bacterium]|jgi:ethanolamine ammonia-lyase small subunit|nr:ethanolamine ammonia-lyase subunit EutC [Clostridia bacterium]